MFSLYTRGEMIGNLILIPYNWDVVGSHALTLAIDPHNSQQAKQSRCLVPQISSSLEVTNHPVDTTHLIYIYIIYIYIYPLVIQHSHGIDGP